MGDSKVKVRIVYEWEYEMNPEHYVGEPDATIDRVVDDPEKMVAIDKGVCEEDPIEFIRIFDEDPKEISFELIGKGDVETTEED